MTETAAPTGYKGTDPVAFQVGQDGNIIDQDSNSITISNTKIKYNVTISKIDSESKEKLAGAKLKITSANNTDQVVKEWTSTDQDEVVELEPGSYILTETAAPTGYNGINQMLFNIDQSGKMFYTDQNGGIINQNDRVITISNTKIKYDIKISKIASETQEKLAGAELKITSASNPDIIISEWESIADEDKIVKLETGSYILKETKAPEGYDSVGEITFEVGEDGNIVGTGSNELAIVNHISGGGIEINKIDSSNGQRLAGAELAIFNLRGVERDSWTSDGISNHIVSLRPGNYTLKETKAPEGYDIADDITFQVDENGNIADQDSNVLTISNNRNKHEIEITKVDADNEKITGAVLEIKSIEDQSLVISNWTSNNYENHKIKLMAGKYILKEVKAPIGYDAISAVQFEVTQEGKIKGQDNNILTISNTKAKYEMKISKVDADTNERLAGARLSLIELKEGNMIDNWLSDSESDHKVEVEFGSYELIEEEAPSGYNIADPIFIEVDGNGAILGNLGNRTVTMKNEKIRCHIRILKTDHDTGDTLPGATLEISKKDGTFKENLETGISPVNIELEPGEYVLKEIKSPEGYAVSDDEIEFQISQDGTLLDHDDNNIIFTNEKMKKGKIYLRNKIQGEISEDIKRNIKFILTDISKGTKTIIPLSEFKYNTNEDIYEKDLGDHYVSKYSLELIGLNSAGGYKLNKVFYSVNDGPQKEENIVYFDIKPDDNVKVEFTEVYEKVTKPDPGSGDDIKPDDNEEIETGDRLRIFAIINGIISIVSLGGAIFILRKGKVKK